MINHTEDAYRRTKEDYEEGMAWHAQKYGRYNWEKQINQFTALLKGNLILDVGCGTGINISIFLEKGVHVEGLDYSQESIAYCRKYFPHVVFYEKEMRNTGFNHSRYNGVWSCASIVNFTKEDARTALLEFKRLLKQDGILFVSVKEGVGERLIKDLAGERYFSFYSLQEIRDIVEQVGFEVIPSEVVKDDQLTGGQSQDKPNWICICAKVI